MVLAPRFAAIRGVWPRVFSSFRGLAKRRVDQRSRPVNLVLTVELGQEHGMKLAPHAGLLPQLEVMPTGFAATTAHVAGQVVPRDACLEDEQDASEDLPIVQGLTAGEAE